jgi:hypothetical protein
MDTGSHMSSSILFGTCTTRTPRRSRAADHVVTANADEGVDLQLGQRRQGVLQGFRIVRHVATGRTEVHAAVEIDAGNLVDRQLVLLVGVALGQPFEAIVESDRHTPQFDRLDGGGADHPVGARCGSAADDDAETLHRHVSAPSTAVRPSSARDTRNAGGTRRV